MSLAAIDLEDLLGRDAAEDEQRERLQKYFLKTSAWTAVTDHRRNLRIVVGNKGTGKSAMFRMAAVEDRAQGRLPVFVQPDHLLGIAEGENDYLRLVRLWKDGLAEVIVDRALHELG